MLRTLAIAFALVALVLPAVTANGAVPAAAADDCDGGVDGIDTLCWHEDCGPSGCVYTFCAVYLPHSGHVHERLFGCTPP